MFNSFVNASALVLVLVVPLPYPVNGQDELANNSQYVAGIQPAFSRPILIGKKNELGSKGLRLTRYQTQVGHGCCGCRASEARTRQSHALPQNLIRSHFTYLHRIAHQ